MLKNPRPETSTCCMGFASLAYIDVIAVRSNIHHCTKHNVREALSHTLCIMPLVPYSAPRLWVICFSLCPPRLHMLIDVIIVTVPFVVAFGAQRWWSMAQCVHILSQRLNALLDVPSCLIGSGSFPSSQLRVLHTWCGT